MVISSKPQLGLLPSGIRLAVGFDVARVQQCGLERSKGCRLSGLGAGQGKASFPEGGELLVPRFHRVS